MKVLSPEKSDSMINKLPTAGALVSGGHVGCSVVILEFTHLCWCYFSSLFTMPNYSTRSKSSLPRNDLSDLDSLSGESRTIVDIVMGHIEALSADLISKLNEKDARIRKLEQDVTDLRRDVVRLEERIDDGDAYERRDTVVLSGDALPPVTSGEICSNLARELFQSKLSVAIASSDISVAHRIGGRPVTQGPDRRSIVVKLCRRDLKRDLLQASRSKKPTNFYVNESLTPRRNAFLQTLRIARRKFPDKISGTGSIDGKVFVWIKPPDQVSRDSRLLINSFTRLDDFCTKTLNISIASLGVTTNISNLWR